MIYAILTEQNISKLFLAAYVPGIIAAVGYIVAIAIVREAVPGARSEDRGARGPSSLHSMVSVSPILAIFLVVFGGIYGGFFTPTEGASIGTMMTFLDRAAARRPGPREVRAQPAVHRADQRHDLHDLHGRRHDERLRWRCRSCRPSWPPRSAHAGMPPLAIMAAIMIFYVILGCVMDELSMIMLTIPVIFPVVMGLDFFGLGATDKAIWFGILILMVVEIGMIFPPVGLNVYIMNGLAKDVPMAETYKGVVPFLISDALRMTLLILFPGITLWLVRMLG